MSDLFAAFESMREEQARAKDIPVRAPFNYPGGKSRSLKEILPHLPHRSFYGEPFGGSGALLLARASSDLEVFNDRCSGVTAFYRCIRDGRKMNAMLDRLNLCLHSREEFVWCRDTWKDCQDDVERGARWWYMVTTSFAAQGMFFGRCNSGKAQIGPKIKNNLKLFPEVHRRLLHVQIENQDWRSILKDFDSKDAVWYLDPPYYSYAKGMYSHEMNKQDHVELIERVFQLKGFVAISGYENELYDKQKWDEKHQWLVRSSSLSANKTETNNLAGHDVQRGLARETLWIKESD